MSGNDKLHAAKKKLEAIKKNHRYRKANKDRAVMAEITYEIAKCAGDLGACLKDFKYTIEEQSFAVRKGRAECYPTQIQEGQLRDAAIGYMLVKDALFVLKSVSSYDSVENAYILLDAATGKITGERVFPFFSGSKKPKREEYAFLNSQEAYQKKQEMYDSFVEKLIDTGDIEACIEEANTNMRNAVKSALSDNFPHDMSVEQLQEAAKYIPQDIDLQNRKELLANAKHNTAAPSDDKKE